ncbi:DUF4198 domain-containing protein [Sphingomonas trueperi]|uniref:DUF4198 domain-containing protein n=1 Tax=Sphingomonas trueperi TaxID=53317 RepID=UPI0033960AC8
MTMKMALTAVLLAAMAGAAQAHEVWVERDGTGPVRIYLGEPAEAAPEGGDPEFANLKAPRILKVNHPTLVRKAGYIEAVVPAGDIRVWDNDVFKPWGADGAKEGVVYYARAGRTEVATQLPFEIAPVASNSSRFQLVRHGKPVAGSKVIVITPDRISKVLVTNAQGVVEVPIQARGRYILSAAVKEDGEAVLAGGAVRTVHNMTTTTFKVP